MASNISTVYSYDTIQGYWNDASLAMMDVLVRYPIITWPYFCCYVCGAPFNIRCPGCGTICYCSLDHQQQDRTAWHSEKCAGMKIQAAKVAELREHPFTFIHEVCCAQEPRSLVLVKPAAYPCPSAPPPCGLFWPPRVGEVKVQPTLHCSWDPQMVGAQALYAGRRRRSQKTGARCAIQY